MTKQIEFGITQAHADLIDEVRATLNMIAVMGMDGTSDHVAHLSKGDLITVLDKAQFRLKQVQDEMTPL
ncbi:hypothetical protein [Acinetobacter populi]|uniref:Uncharacterized protein n=1 Tax=Acinetobacter populi TaxID=1582270 RepID=A0A1Z9Z2Q6_9GAMM|nr:hypothetical protein [Acinetobacter populi]OUY08740.1 hypothetical protein CAP51_03755 [Acinetobacter populi]